MDPEGRLRGAVTAARTTPEQVRLVVDVEGIGEVDAVAPLDQHPGVGEPVRLVRGRHPHRAGGRLNTGRPRRAPLPTLTPVYRRAWVLMVALAAGMAAWAIIEAIVLDKRLVDPEGSFLGPSYIRLPILLLGALLLDLLPLTIWNSWRQPRAIPAILRNRLRTHWTKERITLVAMGIICFYVVYVTYRNIKSFLPFVIETKYDRELHLLDHALLFGHDPATLLHTRARHRHRGARAVLRLPVVPADGAAGRDRLGGLGAQPVLRLLVRDLAVPGLDARHHLLLRAAHARPRLPRTCSSTPTCRTRRPNS